MSSQLIFFQGNDLKSAFQWSRHLSQNQSDNMDVSFTPCVYDYLATESGEVLLQFEVGI